MFDILIIPKQKINKLNHGKNTVYTLAKIRVTFYSSSRKLFFASEESNTNKSTILASKSIHLKKETTFLVK